MERREKKGVGFAAECVVTNYCVAAGAVDHALMLPADAIRRVTILQWTRSNEQSVGLPTDLHRVLASR